MNDVLPAKVLSWIVTGIVSVFILAGLMSSCSTIKPGNAGIIFNRVTGNLYAVTQGIVWKMPFITDVQSYPISLRTYTMVKKSGEGSSSQDDSVDLPTREGQHIKQDISITYNTTIEKASQVFTTFKGEEIESTFIRRTIITVAQNAAGQMSLSELISQKRDDLQLAIQTHLEAELSKMGFKLDKVNLGASHLPQVIEQQMQAKMAAQQQAQQAEYELQKQQLLAKATIAKAEGDAKAKVIEAKAQAEANSMLERTLNDSLLQSKAIEKWDGELPQFLGGNSTPFVTLPLKASHHAKE